MPPSLISPITVQWRPAYDNDSFRYVTKGAESEQPVGAPCYQWVSCRDHAGISRDQRKCVFYDMGPLIVVF